MLLTPRYGSNPVLELHGDPSAVGELMIRQRRRCLASLEQLTDEQWAHPSRCEGWSSKDVAAHLATTNAFWEASIRAGVAGEPTEIMTGFDPVATPAQMVAGLALTSAEILETMATTTESLAACLADLDLGDWNALAESPPGHVTVSAVAHHALWDSWIHERDVLLPLGEIPDEESDEIIACLRYVAGFIPALVLNAGATETGDFEVSVREPDASFHVEIGSEVTVTDGARGSDFVLTGRAVDLLEALSLRAPLEQQVPEALQWAFLGLSTVFDR